MARVGAPAREAVALALARVVEWAREVLGLGAQRPAPEAHYPQPQAVMEHWAA